MKAKRAPCHTKGLRKSMLVAFVCGMKIGFQLNTSISEAQEAYIYENGTKSTSTQKQ